MINNVYDETKWSKMIQVSSFGLKYLSLCPRCSRCACSCIGFLASRDARYALLDPLNWGLSGPWDLLCSIFQTIKNKLRINSATSRISRAPKDSKGEYIWIIKQPETLWNIHLMMRWMVLRCWNGRNCLRSPATRKRKAHVYILCKQYLNNI
jgi:hypothetical protein